MSKSCTLLPSTLLVPFVRNHFTPMLVQQVQQALTVQQHLHLPHFYFPSFRHAVLNDCISGERYCMWAPGERCEGWCRCVSEPLMFIWRYSGFWSRALLPPSPPARWNPNNYLRANVGGGPYLRPVALRHEGNRCRCSWRCSCLPRWRWGGSS